MARCAVPLRHAAGRVSAPMSERGRTQEQHQHSLSGRAAECGLQHFTWKQVWQRLQPAATVAVVVQQVP